MSGNQPTTLRVIPTVQQIHAQHHAARYANSSVLGIAWFKQYPGDNLRISRGWPTVALGAYHAVRDLQWDRGCLPLAPDEIRRLLGMALRDWRIAWPLLQEHFPADSDKFRRNPALAKQRYEAIGKRWQQLDAINLRHRPNDWYRGKAADAYRTVVATGVRSDELTHQHQLRNAYEGGGDVLRESQQSREVRQ
ncbi:MAG: hypothetical protein JSR67_12905 [Proteobacteria bacterium]|nr:hypothetical protein [Pseudomonadota bacterium]